MRLMMNKYVLNLKKVALATGMLMLVSTYQTAANASKKVVNIGSDMTFPPYEYLENGTPKGVDIEIMQKMAELDGSIEVNWMDTRWVNLIPGLKSKKFDVLYSSMYITKERLEQIDMIPYLKTDISLLVLKGSEYQPKGPMDLCGRTVGAMKGTSFVTQVETISAERCVAQGQKPITIRQFETSPQTTQALLAHAVEVQYDDAAVMSAAVKSLPKRVEISSTESFFPVISGIGVRKGDKETYDLINNGLEKMKKSGDLQRILNEYGIKEPTAEDLQKILG